MHKESYEQIKKFANNVAKDALVIDIGSYNVNGCYRDLFSTQTYVGLDQVKGPNVDIVLESPFNFPLFDNSVDVVISGNTLEHVTMPWKLVLEMDRVLKHGGLMALTVPWGHAYHKYPIDCWRFSPDALSILFGEWMVENDRQPYKIIENRFYMLDTFFIGEKI